MANVYHCSNCETEWVDVDRSGAECMHCGEDGTWVGSDGRQDPKEPWALTSDAFASGGR